MADSTLDPDYLTGGPDRSLGRGHGTDALGPSDTSDTGSDMQGVGLSGNVGLDMDEMDFYVLRAHSASYC